MIARPELGIRGQPELLFQPAVDMRTGHVLGFEALVRWNDPVQGLFGPDVLLPWARAAGHMAALTTWVMSEACWWATQWDRNLQLAVNCSESEIEGRTAAAAATQALEETGLHPDRLSVEFTSAAVSDNRAVAELAAISRLGVHLTMDDVGHDWSALRHVQQFGIDTIKIDGRVIGGLGFLDGVSPAIVNSIITTSRALGVCPVAEGVETREQVSALTELGADVAQGYLFCPPVPAKEARAMCAGDDNLLPAREPSAAAQDGGSESSGEADDEAQWFVTQDISLSSRRRRLPATLRRGKHSLS
jgi:EAL domain-containing protein (putative c-di-GMP-specific phosphodiesterase class I)